MEDASWEEQRRALSYYIERHSAVVMLKASGHSCSDDPLIDQDPIAAACRIFGAKNT